MVFSNLIFLYLFLPANILLYYITKNPAWRNGVLIVFSLFLRMGGTGMGYAFDLQCYY